MSEKFNLKWNDFQSNISKTFSSLRTDSHFYDVTLVSEDLQQMSAHRVVLSACSQYFSDVLRQTKHSNPLLCLEGVTSTELQFILDYIYQGEVQIYQENLDRFLAVAERFKLEGLINLPDNSKQEEERVYQTEESAPSQRTTPNSGQRKNYSQVRKAVQTGTEATAVVNIEMGEDLNLEEIEAKLAENIQKEYDGTFSCKVCGKSGVKHIRNMKNHVETHIEGLSFPCQICGKTFRQRNSLNIHKHRHHRS